jgi:hypothetical protein
MRWLVGDFRAEAMAAPESMYGRHYPLSRE